MKPNTSMTGSKRPREKSRTTRQSSGTDVKSIWVEQLLEPHTCAEFAPAPKRAKVIKTKTNTRQKKRKVEPAEFIIHTPPKCCSVNGRLESEQCHYRTCIFMISRWEGLKPVVTIEGIYMETSFAEDKMITVLEGSEAADPELKIESPFKDPTRVKDCLYFRLPEDWLQPAFMQEYIIDPFPGIAYIVIITQTIDPCRNLVTTVEGILEKLKDTNAKVGQIKEWYSMICSKEVGVDLKEIVDSKYQGSYSEVDEKASWVTPKEFWVSHRY
ncbi:uncharacterized protein PAC_08488 [Phialocephala subalpina]|uniref:Uncharacterized protein n=1 Tax=Phialocephala subalpina TaxID=576137 RepID=A0A1L7X0Q8_9HELO|nr:uncharacterized protein PAC_08488 [Phialocephala subalpina]